MIISVFPVCSIFSVNASVSQSLGAISECVSDLRSNSVKIAGSIKHSVLVANRGARIAVYRFDPWEDYESLIDSAVPLASMEMTIRFEFEVACKTVADRMSLYAVAIVDENGKVTLISEPQYVNCKTGDTANAGFKGVITEDIPGAAASHAGSGIIDVYLDSLDNGKKSGYIFNVDGELFYFDREAVHELDKKVLTYTASGSKVYLRFLISPLANSLEFCTQGMNWATNKCVAVKNRAALNELYAFTYFLISRYDGGDYGKADGIILGRGADMPILYNFANPGSEDYERVYSRSLSLIGLAASEASGNSNISLIVPVGDTVIGGNKIYATEFLNSVAKYLESYTKLTFTVMCESRHNPYKLTDGNFSTEIVPDETTETDTEVTLSPDTSLMSPEEETAGDPASADTDEATADAAEDATSSEETVLTPNQNSDGYFCTDNINIFLNFFNKLKREYSSVNDGFGWVWHPNADSSESALGVCYAYNYMKLSSVGADFYSVAFENDVKDKFSNISYLFKYIDTDRNIAETEFALSALGVSDWSELIPEYEPGMGVRNVIFESTVMNEPEPFNGSLVFLDHSKGTGNGGWYAGYYCNQPTIKQNGGNTALIANMSLDDSSLNSSEIGYIFKQPEPLLIADALTFDLVCGEQDGSLYEISVYLYSSKGTIVSRGVIAGGVKSVLSVDVASYDKTAAVSSIKIAVKRLTGSGDCLLQLSSVTINSNTATDEELIAEFNDVLDYLRSEKSTEQPANNRTAFFLILILLSFGAAALLIAYGNDRRNKAGKEEYNA